MNLMLGVMFLCVALGLASTRFGPRTHLTVAAIAIVMAAIYFLYERAM
jgi:hypothetical protein